jgi:lipoprotein Spr
MGVRIRKDQLKQGDLVFFNTTGGISHVGVYLANNKFVHAAASAGVMISDLEDAYYKRRYIGATRVK